MNNLDKLLQEFERSLKTRNFARRTISESRRKLRRFFDYLISCSITDVDGISRDIVRAYQVELYQSVNAKGYPNAVSYQNSMIAVVKQFLTFLRENDYIAFNPARDIQYAKAPKRLPRNVLSPSEARKIMHRPDTKSVFGYRDRTILELLYCSGLRKAELRNIKLCDVDYHDGLLMVKGKGNKERVVPIGKIACRYLENYIKSVRPELIKDPYNNHLFLSSRGNRLNHNAVWVLVKKYAKKAGIRKNVHCHTFRHTCATAMLKNKADIRVIQELLGHSSLNSTQIYTRVTITDLKEVHEKCHPREKDRE